MRSNSLRTAMALVATAAMASAQSAVQGVAETARSAAHELSELGQGLTKIEMQALTGGSYHGYHTGRYAKKVGGTKNPAGTKLHKRAVAGTVGRAYLK